MGCWVWELCVTGCLCWRLCANGVLGLGAVSVNGVLVLGTVCDRVLVWESVSWCAGIGGYV